MELMPWCRQIVPEDKAAIDSGGQRSSQGVQGSRLHSRPVGKAAHSDIGGAGSQARAKII